MRQTGQGAYRKFEVRQEANMRHLHSDAHFRHALYALQGADGYVEALLDMARENARRASASRATPRRTSPSPERGYLSAR